MPSDKITPERASQAELARLLGVTRQAIGNHVSSGVLLPDADGRMDIEQARVALANQVRLSGKSNAANAVQTPAPNPEPPAVVPGMSYHIAKTLREATEASIAQVKLRRMQAELIEREPAEQAAFTAFRGLRDTIKHQPRRLAGQLATMTDAREIELFLDRALAEVLTTFATKTLPQFTRRLSQAEPQEATA